MIYFVHVVHVVVDVNVVMLDVLWIVVIDAIVTTITITTTNFNIIQVRDGHGYGHDDGDGWVIG